MIVMKTILENHFKQVISNSARLKSARFEHSSKHFLLLPLVKVAYFELSTVLSITQSMG